MDPSKRNARLDALLGEQSVNWTRGRPVAVEALLAANPELAGDAAAVVDLLLHELVLRERAGERPDPEEFVRRFPHLADAIRRQFALHRQLEVSGPRGFTPPPMPMLSALETCGALAGEQLASVRVWLQNGALSEVELGRELIGREWLTAFQVNRLLSGGEMTLGDYLLRRRLGAGGMGQVYEARHRHSGRVVAIKVIRGDRQGDADAVRRFQRESKVILGLNHRHVIKAIEAGQHGDTHYLVMEYVDGMDAAALLARRGPLPIPAACEVVRQAALGLDHAHGRGIIHRDVKPSNLMLARPSQGDTVDFPTVKVLDLGLARRHHAEDDDSTTLTQAGTVMGTPDYVAPEQIRDAHTADARSDLYSLGCSFYHLLTGRPPFSGLTLGLKLLQHQTDEPELPEHVRSEIPLPVSRIVRRLMAKKPADRFQTAREVAAVLRALLRAGDWAATPFAALEGEPDDVIRAVYRWRGHSGLNRRHLLLAAGSAALLMTGGGAVWWLSRKATTPPPPPPPPDPTALQQLSRDKIPAGERFDWQPKQVVAVLGDEQRGRHWSQVNCVAVSPDGTVAATAATWGDWVRLWEVDPARPADLLRERVALPVRSAVLAMAFVDGGRTLITTQDPMRGSLQRWEVATGRLLGEVPGVGGTSISSSGRLVLHAMGRPLVPTLSDADNGQRLWQGEQQPPVANLLPLGSAFLPNEGGFFLPDADHVIELRDLKGTVVRRFSGHKRVVRSLACSSDGKRLYSTSNDDTLRLWDVASGKELSQAAAGTSATVALSPDDRLVAVFPPVGHGIPSLLTAEGLRPVGTLLGAAKDRLGPGAFVPRCHRLLVGSGYGALTLWNLETLESLGPARAHPWGVYCVALSGDGRRAFTGSLSGDKGRLWELPACRSIARLPDNAASVLAAVFSPDPEGRWLLVNESGRARLYDGRTLQLVRDFPGDDVYRQAIAFTPDGKHVAIAGGPDKADEQARQPWAIRLHDVDSGVVKRTFVGHVAPVVALSFSADGEYLLSGANATRDRRDRTLRLWKVHSGLQMRTLPVGFPQPFDRVALSPDGRFAACSAHENVYVWDLSKDANTTLKPFTDHKGGDVEALRWSSDGKRLYSADHLGRIVARGMTAGVLGVCKLPGAIRDLAVAADDEHLLTANANGTAYVLRLPLSPPSGRG